jgi:ribokinase
MTQPEIPASVTIVGSLNIDLVVRTLRRPNPGETLRGTGFDTFVGGKGLNQAIAAARAGAQTAIVGCIGADSYGDTVLQKLEADNINTAYLQRDPEAGTGCAFIVVEQNGENSIITVPRANLKLGNEAIEAARPQLEKTRILLMQLEIPLETASAAAWITRVAGGMVILNTAPVPAMGLPIELLSACHLLIANEGEASLLSGIEVTDLVSAKGAASVLQALGIRTKGAYEALGLRNIIITLGAQGALVAEAGKEPVLVASFPVTTVDTTAAGDSFCGALAAALAQGASLPEAAQYGAAAGALAVTRLGAEPSIPRAEQIRELLK